MKQTGAKKKATPEIANLASQALSMFNTTACKIATDGAIEWLDDVVAARLLGDPVPYDRRSLINRLGAPAPGGALTRIRRFIEPQGSLRVFEERAIRHADGTMTIGFRPITDTSETTVEPMMRDVALALAENRVRLAFQPIVDATSHKVIRYECLLRLERQDGSPISPADFIPAAERAGLVGRLDLHALKLALDVVARRPAISLSVNVSAGTIGDDATLADYVGTLRSAGELASRITVEITETIALDDLPAAVAFADSIRDLGARLSLDDFGAGYTSFRTLRALPLSEVKIDGAYVRDVHKRADSRAFVRALHDLASDLGLETVAEWVSAPEDADVMRELGIVCLQGYLYGAPVELEPEQ